MADPDGTARPDPTRDGWVIVRSGGAGVSLGRGAFPESAAQELCRHDLADLRGEGEGRRYAASDAGRARLRRDRAADADDAFRGQHLDLAAADIVDDEGRRRVVLNTAESPLDWLRRRRDRDGEPLIDAASFEAGERLRRDLTIGGILPSVSARWEATGSSGGLRDPAAATDATIAARQRVRQALAAVGGDFADLLIDLCGFLKGLETVERERAWPPRSAKVVVRLALRRLAEHYGLEVEARGRPSSAGIRTWRPEPAAPSG